MGDLVPTTWNVVFQTPEKALVLFNPSLQEIRTVAPSGNSPFSSIRWNSPTYFRILAELMKRRGELPPSLDNFLMNGYFERFFPVRQKIGNGGCGSVYRVEHILAGIRLAEYAVKVIPVGEFSWLQRVISEVKLLEKLAQKPHPLILGYKHCWIEEWQPALFGPKIPCLFILMEFAPLGNLESLLSTKIPGKFRNDLTNEEIWQIFLNIAVAVHHLHSLGIIHRDLKLSNVLLFEEKNNSPLPLRLVLSDFGTSIDVQMNQANYSRTGATGTVETMAPELLIQGKNGSYLFSHSYSSDIWSLGVILFSLFYHCNPFGVENGEQLLRRFTTLDNLIKELKLENQNVPVLAMKLLNKMMQVNPKNRCSIDDILMNTEVDEMICKFGLETYLKSDGPRRVFVVSPSMEDLESSVVLALPDDTLMEEETQTDLIFQDNNNVVIHKNNRNELHLKILLLLELLSQPSHTKKYSLIRFVIYSSMFFCISDLKTISVSSSVIILLELLFGLCSPSFFLILLHIFLCFVCLTEYFK